MTTTLKGKAKYALLSYLAGVSSATRQEVLDGAMRQCSPSCKLETLQQSGRYATVRSYLGATLSELVRSGEVIRDGRGYRLAQSGDIMIRRSDVERKLRATLKQRSATKESLLHTMHRLMGTDATSSPIDDQLLCETVESLLDEMLTHEEIRIEQGRYTIQTSTHRVKETMTLEELRIAFFDLLSARGGPAFEVYVAGLLEKLYMMRGDRVMLSETTGGSADGGIDVELHVKDALGFIDRILIQTKCRIRNHVTEKEVREFYGAMCAKQGSRGMYVTTSTFHPTAQNFLSAIDRIVGIDGEALLHMAIEVSYGIRTTKSGYRIDTRIFE